MAHPENTYLINSNAEHWMINMFPLRGASPAVARLRSATQNFAPPDVSDQATVGRGTEIQWREFLDPALSYLGDFQSC